MTTKSEDLQPGELSAPSCYLTNRQAALFAAVLLYSRREITLSGRTIVMLATDFETFLEGH